MKAMGFVFRVLDTYDVMEKVCAKVNRQEDSASAEHWKANHKCELDKKRKVSSMLSVAHRRTKELEEALRVMTDVFHPRGGPPDSQMYVETMTHQKAMDVLEGDNDDNGN